MFFRLHPVSLTCFWEESFDPSAIGHSTSLPGTLTQEMEAQRAACCKHVTHYDVIFDLRGVSVALVKPC